MSNLPVVTVAATPRNDTRRNDAGAHGDRPRFLVGLVCAVILCITSRDTLAIGLSVYDVVSGNLAIELDPTFSGGAFSGQTLSGLSIHDIAGYRDTNTAQLALFEPIPEPSSMVLGSLSVGCLALLRFFRRRSVG